MRRVLIDLLTSKLVQSLGFSPTDLSITLGIILCGFACCLVALRGSGCDAGGAGIAELELVAPGLDVSSGVSSSPSFSWGPGTVAFGSSTALLRASLG